MGNQENKQHYKPKTGTNRPQPASHISLANQHYGKNINATESAKNPKQFQYNPQTDIQHSQPSLGNQQYGNSKMNPNSEQSQNLQSVTAKKDSDQRRKGKASENQEVKSEKEHQKGNPKVQQESESQVTRNERNVTQNQYNQDPTTDESSLEEY